MVARFVCCEFCSICLTALGVAWIVLAAVEITLGVRQSLDAMLDGLTGK